MLLAIREKVTGWIAYGIIFLISIPFALWGVGEYFGGGTLPPAATVNGEEVSQIQFDRAYANYRQRLLQLFGGSIPDSFGDETALRLQVLDQMVEEIALHQYVEAQRYRIGEEDLNQLIWDMEVFHSDGKFDPDRYQAQLSSVGLSSEAFKQDIRRNGTMEQFQNGIVATSFLVPAQSQQYVSLQNQSRQFRSLSYREARDRISVSEAEIEDYYQQNSLRFLTPEQVRIDYIDLNLDSIKEGIVVDEAISAARYQENIKTYTSLEVREASHILIKVDNNADPAPGLAEIEALRHRIQNGESFADLAREHSQDTASAAAGGSLGEVERGVMVEAFEDALFNLQEGQLSEPVKSAFGWHLILLHSIVGGVTQEFADVRLQLEDEIKTEMAESQIYDLVETLSNIAYEQPDSLAPAADQLELPIETTSWFGRGAGTGIAAETKIREIAFSEEVLSQRLNSQAIELGPDRVVFIRLNQHHKPEQRPLDEVRDQIELELISMKLREQSEQMGNAALVELNEGKSLDELASEWGLSVTDYGFVERNKIGVDAEIIGAAFAMPKPEQGPVFEGLTLAGGDYVIIELTAVISNDGSVDQAALDRLIESQAGNEYGAVQKLVASRAEVSKTPLEDLGY